MEHDGPGAASSPSSDEPHLTRVSMFGQLNSSRTADREAAWAAFRARYAPMIGGFARRFGAGRQDVDDIVQDVMVGFVAASGEFVYDPSRGRFRGWLKTAAVRAAIRRAGKNLRFRGVPLDSVPDVEAAVEPLWNDVWEKQMMAQALAAVRRRHGNDANFRAFEQYVLHERPPGDVAADLGITVERVYQAKTRITRELREMMAVVDE